ncbi:GNAT family N-acetyltransferase, partial [Campylobacter porcelli]|nr:GNAT family N-acetyltransferase [Campylobacter sp. CX2-4855-23]
MLHSFKEKGIAYSIRPVTLDDAQFIIDIRLEDSERNKYIHKISRDLKLQINWLNKYFKSPDDYYFVVENNLTGEKEGLISIYNVKDGAAELGRWVVKKGSMATIESIQLAYKFAFEKLNLVEVYTKTIQDNALVVEFHKSIGAKTKEILINEFTIDGQNYNAVWQFIDRDNYFSCVSFGLEEKSIKIFQRNLKVALGNFEFHHIGIATKNIEKEFKTYAMLGYTKEAFFDGDINQGVKGLFITAKNQPRLELLENLEGSNTLDYWLKQGIKLYHFGYMVNDIDKAFDIFTVKLGAKVVSPMKISQFFGKRICFVVLKNMF